MTYDPGLMYSVLVTSPDAPARVAEALSEIFGVPVDRVDVCDMEELDDRNWDAAVSCQYGRLSGDLSWSLSVYATEAAAQPPEEDLALWLARRLDCPALFPGKETVPSIWLAATADGRVTHAEVEEPEDEDGPWYVRAVEEPVGDFPGARVGPFRSLVRELPIPTPVAEGQDAATSDGPLREIYYLLVSWERLTVRMSTGWPPSHWYPADLYRDDLAVRDRLAEAVTALPDRERQVLSRALDLLDDHYRRHTYDDAGTALLLALGEQADAFASRPWYWHRRPEPTPWDAPASSPSEPS